MWAALHRKLDFLGRSTDSWLKACLSKALKILPD